MALAAMSLLSWDSSARMWGSPPSLISSGYSSGEPAMACSLCTQAHHVAAIGHKSVKGTHKHLTKEQP